MVATRQATLDDAEVLGLITVAASLGTFIGRIPEQDLELGWRPEDSAAGWRETMARLPADQFFLVAEVGQQVAGFVWAGPSTRGLDGEGEIRGLYVRPTRQRQGLGRLLIARAVDRMGQAGPTSSLIIGCIEENPSCEFYRHLGGIESFRRPNSVDHHRTEEIFFRWADATILSESR